MMLTMSRSLSMVSLFLLFAACVDELPPAQDEGSFDMTPAMSSGENPGQRSSVDMAAVELDARALPGTDDGGPDESFTDADRVPVPDVGPIAQDAEIPIGDPEVCDGNDNDGDGQTDEGFALEEACSVGMGACAVTGRIVCDDAGETICAALPGTPEPEVCNEIDDDCDGRTDEDFETLEECSVGVGACVRGGLVARACASPARSARR